VAAANVALELIPFADADVAGQHLIPLTLACMDSTVYKQRRTAVEMACEALERYGRAFSLASDCMDVILRAVGDSSSEVAERAEEYLKSTLSDKCGECLPSILSAFLTQSEDGQRQYLRSLVTSLLKVSEKSPSWESLLFSEPLSANCEFQEQRIDTSWRTQTVSSQAPRFVETMSSLSSQAWRQTQGRTNLQQFIRATQTSMEFEQTQVAEDDKSEDREMVVPLASQEQNAPSSQSQGFLRAGRRFKKSGQTGDFDRSKAHFARHHARREKMRRFAEDDRRGRRQGGVVLVRSYRTGELPDVQIKQCDLLNALKSLAVADEHCASLFVGLIGKEMSKAKGGRDFPSRLRSSLEQALSTTKLHHRPAARTVLDLSLHFEVNVDCQRLRTLCRELRLERNGILLLQNQVARPNVEPRTKKRRSTGKGPSSEEDQNIYANMADLFKALNDLESTRGVAIAAGADEDTLKLVSLEASGSWLEVKRQAEEMLKSATDENQKRALIESRLTALEKLSDWGNLSAAVDECGEDVAKDVWAKEFLLPKTVRAKMHHALEDQQEVKRVGKIFEHARQNDKDFFDYLRHRFGADMALLYLHQSKQSDARVALEAMTKAFMREWVNDVTLSPADNVQRLTSLKRLSQIDLGLSNFSPKAKFGELTESWGNRLRQRPDLANSLQDYDDLLRDRAIILQALEKSGRCEESSVFKLRGIGRMALADRCNEIGQWEVAINALTLGKKEKALADSEELATEFEKLYNDAVAVKACKDLSAPPGKRFNALYRSLMEFEERVGEPDGFKLKVRMTLACEELLAQFDQDAGVHMITESLAKEARKEHFAAFSAGLETVRDLRPKMLHSVKETMEGKPDWLDCRHWLDLANTCYTLLTDYGDFGVAATLAKSHLRAISGGSSRARLLFPNLMEAAEAMDADALTVLKKELKEVQAWMFLPWSTQLLSSLTTSAGRKIWSKLVLRIAHEFPGAVKYPYLILKESNVDVALNALDDALKLNPLEEKLVNGFSNLCLPLIKLKDCLKEMRQGNEDTAKKSKLDDIKKHFTSQSDLYGSAYQDCARRIFSRGVSDYKKVSELVSGELEKLKQKRLNPPKDVGSYVPFFADFHSSGSQWQAEIPGQYGGFQRPRPEDHARLMCFQRSLILFSSLRRPMSVGVVGDDGRVRDFIVKCEEDLRLDERIQQVFGVANRSFEHSGLNVRVKTYKVVPLTKAVGLIERLSDVIPYSGMAKPKQGIGGLCASQSDFLALMKERTAEDREKDYDKLLAQTERDRFKESLMQLSTSSNGFFFMRDNFLRTHAAHSICGWLVSLGDRHADNLLVSTVTGDSVAIDFGYSFGATAFLPIPELVPFRLTPQMTALATPAGVNGPVRETMIAALSSLRSDAAVFLAALSVFIREPTSDWLENAKRLARKKGAPLREEEVIKKKFPSAKVAVVRDKLSGASPAETAFLELEFAAADVKMLAPVKKALMGKRNSQDESALNPQEQVRRSIKSLFLKLVLGGLLAGLGHGQEFAEMCIHRMESSVLKHFSIQFIPVNTV